MIQKKFIFAALAAILPVAWSKCAEVIATMADSGNPDALD